MSIDHHPQILVNISWLIRRDMLRNALAPALQVIAAIALDAGGEDDVVAQQAVDDIGADGIVVHECRNGCRGTNRGGQIVQRDAVALQLVPVSAEEVDAACDENYVCTDDGFAAVDRFRTMGNVSTASFIVGGVLAGVGVTLVLVSSRAPTSTGANVRVRTGFAPGFANFALEGAF